MQFTTWIETDVPRMQCGTHGVKQLRVPWTEPGSQFTALFKKRFRTFWAYRYPGAAKTFFTRWYWRATHSRLKPMAAVTRLIKRHLPNLLTYLRHRLTPMPVS